jgi:hypothetical protein
MLRRQAPPALGFALALATALTACGGSREPGAASCPGSVSWTEASSVAGEVATVRGPVAGASYRPDVRGAPTYINLGVDYPNKERFTAIIWGRDRSKFPDSPEAMYSGVGVCVRGRVTEYRGVPQIEVREPDAIVAASANAMAGDDTAEPPTNVPERAVLTHHDLRSLERFQKAVKRWNALNRQLVKFYRSMPPNIFVIAGRHSRQSLTRLTTDMATLATAFEGPIGGYLAPLSRVYLAERIDFGLLVKAVAAGNPVAEQGALRLLTRDAVTKTRAVQRLMSRARAAYGNHFADLLAGFS